MDFQIWGVAVNFPVNHGWDWQQARRAWKNLRWINSQHRIFNWCSIIWLLHGYSLRLLTHLNSLKYHSWFHGQSSYPRCLRHTSHTKMLSEFIIVTRLISVEENRRPIFLFDSFHLNQANAKASVPPEHPQSHPLRIKRGNGTIPPFLLINYICPNYNNSR